MRLGVGSDSPPNPRESQAHASCGQDLNPLWAFPGASIIVALGQSEVGFSRLIGLRAALFPIPQSSKRDFGSCGKFFLGQREGAAKRHQCFSYTAAACTPRKPAVEYDER